VGEDKARGPGLRDAGAGVEQCNAAEEETGRSKIKEGAEQVSPSG